MSLGNLVSDSFLFNVVFRHCILTKRKSSCFRKSTGWKFFISLTCPHSLMCIKIYIFNFRKQTNKQKKKKKARIKKKQKKLKKKNFKVAIHEKEHTWWTFYKLTKGTGFVADQTNLKVKHGLVTYSMLV